jgi:hypothetical protein
VLPGGPGAQQRAAGQQVDAPRHAARQAVDALERGRLKGQRPGVPGHGQPVLDVLDGLGLAQRVQMKAGNHALGQLLQLGARQHAAQLGLADQHDLQQLALAGFQVGQQAQLLQHVGAEVLCLVDDQHAALAGRVALQQESVQRVDVVLDRDHAAVGGRHRNVELLAHRLQQLRHRQLGVEDVGHMAACGDLLQEAAAHRGLAGADVAGQQHEAATRAAHRAAGGGHAVQQVRQRLAVALAHEEVPRVRRDGERVLRQAEVVRVHGREHSAIARNPVKAVAGVRKATAGSRGGPFLSKNG